VCEIGHLCLLLAVDNHLHSFIYTLNLKRVTEVDVAIYSPISLICKHEYHPHYP